LQEVAAVNLDINQIENFFNDTLKFLLEQSIINRQLINDIRNNTASP